ncbi:MAG: peptidylprolyl isomerase [Deltaproteobacteria bacterium]|nr:peptidylprolyl isomerase [Deltaproteobacteria bacterium]
MRSAVPPRLSLRLAWVALAVVPAAAAAEPIEGLAAVVGDDVILVSEVQEHAATALARLAQEQSAFIRDQTMREILAQHLDQMIDELLVEQEARRLMLEVTEEEVDRAIDGIKQRNGWDDFGLENQIAQRGQTLEQYRRETRLEVLKYKVLSVRLRGRMRTDDAEVRRAYRQIVRASRSEDTFEAAQVLVQVPAGASAIEVQRLEERAEAVARRAREGEDFGELARDFSDDPATAAVDGSLGTLRRGDLPASLDEELVMLDVGEVAGPVRGPEGFYVLKLVAGRITGVRSFEEARRGIENQIMERMMQRQEDVFLANLRRKTHVERRLQ